MRQVGDFVPASGRSDDELFGNSTIASVKRERLFGGEAPLRLEALPEIHSAEQSVRRIPSGTFAFQIIGSARDQPTVYHPQEEAVGQQSVPVGAGDVCGADRPSMLMLELGENLQGLS